MKKNILFIIIFILLVLSIKINKKTKAIGKVEFDGFNNIAKMDNGEEYIFYFLKEEISSGTIIVEEEISLSIVGLEIKKIKKIKVQDD